MNARLIVAMSKERLIGRDNDLPWHWPEDLKHFKRSTRGGTVIMGRRSYESLGGKPLPKRTNLVVSRSQGADAGPDGREEGGVRIFGSLQDACAWAERARRAGEFESVGDAGDPADDPGDDPGDAWILGGSEIFRLALAPLDDGPQGPAEAGLPRPTELVVTWVPSVPMQDGDILFPFDEAWIDRHYDAAERWPNESGELEFVRYVLRDAPTVS